MSIWRVVAASCQAPKRGLLSLHPIRRQLREQRRKGRDLSSFYSERTQNRRRGWPGGLSRPMSHGIENASGACGSEAPCSLRSNFHQRDCGSNDDRGSCGIMGMGRPRRLLGKVTVPQPPNLPNFFGCLSKRLALVVVAENGEVNVEFSHQPVKSHRAARTCEGGKTALPLRRKRECGLRAMAISPGRRSWRAEPWRSPQGCDRHQSGYRGCRWRLSEPGAPGPCCRP